MSHDEKSCINCTGERTAEPCPHSAQDWSFHPRMGTYCYECKRYVAPPPVPRTGDDRPEKSMKTASSGRCGLRWRNPYGAMMTCSLGAGHGGAHEDKLLRTSDPLPEPTSTGQTNRLHAPCALDIQRYSMGMNRDRNEFGEYVVEFFQVVARTVYRSDSYECHVAFFATEEEAREFVECHHADGCEDQLVILACVTGTDRLRCEVAVFDAPQVPA